MKVIVIGGGPAGMMAAITAAENGAEVTLVEANEKVGKKLYITGKGRCNVTNACPPNEFLDNVIGNRKFVISAVNRFTPADTVAFLAKQGLETKVERGRRVFPASDKSSDVIKALSHAMKSAGVNVLLNTRVTSIDTTAKDVIADSRIHYDRVVIATGGLSYKATGSTGDGYVFAKSIGHKIIPTVPALTGIRLHSSKLAQMAGLALTNCSLTIVNGSKQLYTATGEMLFTHIGLSGAVALTASSYINRLSDYSKCYAIIDMKPYLDNAELDSRIVKVFAQNTNKALKNVLRELLPSSIIDEVISASNIQPLTKVNSISKEQRGNLVNAMKNLKYKVDGLDSIESGVVTAGGVCVAEINPTTMRSKLDNSVFFAGEVIDIDALTGGYNIQLALSTGYLAGLNAAKEEM